MELYTSVNERTGEWGGQRPFIWLSVHVLRENRVCVFVAFVPAIGKNVCHRICYAIGIVLIKRIRSQVQIKRNGSTKHMQCNVS